MLSHLGVAGFARVAEGLFEEGVRGNTFDLALGRLGLATDPSMISNLVEVYRSHFPDLMLPEETAKFLREAVKRFRLALVTDGYIGVQRRKVEALGIASWFEAIVYTDQWGRSCWKPHPAGFQHVMHVMPGEATGYVYLGDNPRKDFLAPRALGWGTVRVRRPNGEHAAYEPTRAEAADGEVVTLAELGGVLGL
jgi:putative hydrolase of the HAD superfamily